MTFGLYSADNQLFVLGVGENVDEESSGDSLT
jgi:hypothetical protein